MTTTADEALVFPFQRGCPFDPAPTYGTLRVERPVTKVQREDGGQSWLLTRYDDIRALLTDPRVSVEPRIPGDDAMARPGWFINMDPPKHDFLRRMLTKEFMIRRLEAMRPSIEKVVNDLIDDMLAGPNPVDFVPTFAYPLPSFVICKLLGVPYEDHDFFQSRTQIMASRSTTSVEERNQAAGELVQYLTGLVEKKEKEPGDDLISRLIAEQVRNGALTAEELAGMSTVLLGAGHETTGNMTAIGLLTLLDNPDQLEALRADPSLVGTAVDELLRYLSIIETANRTALEDIDFGGQTIKKGDGIIFALASANRDESVFTDPDRLDISRQARDHAAFGAGIHFCTGAPLARLELEIAFNILLARVPTLRLAVPVEEIPFKHGMAAYGVHELPVTW
jgi:cytochrome P450